MDSQLCKIIRAIHDSKIKGVFAATGGGSQALAWLLSVPGASRTVVESVIPYDTQALAEFLGFSPVSSCSVGTGRDMALRAYQRATWLCPGEKVLGVGCTASLATDRRKSGEHRFFVSVQTGGGLRTSSLVLAKEVRDRQEEENILDLVFLNCIAEAVNIAERLTVPLLPGEKLEIEHPDDSRKARLEKEIFPILVESDGLICRNAPRPRLLLSGAFNPLHQGHERLAAEALALTGLIPNYEISLENVDKPSLSWEEVHRRLAQFAWQAPVWLTRAATFVEKARLFPGATFVLGADTAIRLISPKYYQDSTKKMLAALEEIHEKGCRFVVAGREDAWGKFLKLESLEIPQSFLAMFQEIPENKFRFNVSSTRLRKDGDSFAFHP